MSDMTDIHARLAVVEHRVNNIDMKFTGIDNKLDELLALKAKGAGAFWLVSIIVGTGLFGMVATIISWIKT